MGQKQDELRSEALAFAEELAKKYFIERELPDIPELMGEKISLIGTGIDEVCQNLPEVVEALKKEMLEYSGVFSITDQWFRAVPFSDTVCLVYGTVQIVPGDMELSEETLRISVLTEKTEDGMKLVHLHLSRPDSDQEQGRYFVAKSARSDSKTLKRTLELRSRQLETLNRNIPGGAHQCKNDPNLTIISMSDSFLTMFGYTREEIKTLYHNHFIEMVYPSDRKILLASVRNQLEKGRDTELEYRVLCKNGQPVWILDKCRLLDDGNGGENFYCLLIEITERKMEQEALRLSLERHQVIVDQATDIIFEWDICNDTLSFSQNWQKKFGYAAIGTEISEHIPMSKNIHPDDIPAFVKIMKDTAAGVSYSETEFRIKDITGRYFWCRIRATAQFDSDGRPIKAIGIIVDIDSEKRQKQALLDMAQKDMLTGLYNKTTINSLVERRMEGYGNTVMQALFILDVDNFKKVNDTYGHLVGDGILSNVAAVIKAHTRSSDLAGRIGGDEFLIYLPEVYDEAVVRSKAEKLLESLKTLVPEEGAQPITCSMGVAVFPHDSIDYYTLYQYADTALYARKKNGRNGVTIYSPSIGDMSSVGDVGSAVGGAVETDDVNVVDEQLAQYAFRRLYVAKDIEATINRLLEIIGRAYDVSRAYIFESSEDGKTCSNTFEWCADGVEPQIDSLQNISYIDDLGDYLKNFNKRGLFYCAEVSKTHPDVRAVLEPQGIRSMLQCAMLDEGEFVGYVGFDECRENRKWSDEQVETFKLTADVLSTFLMKLRQKQRNRKDQ